MADGFACLRASIRLPIMAPSSEPTTALTMARIIGTSSNPACGPNSTGTSILKPIIPNTSPSPLPIFSLLDLLFTAISLLPCRCRIGSMSVTRRFLPALCRKNGCDALGDAIRPPPLLIGRQDSKTASAWLPLSPASKRFDDRAKKRGFSDGYITFVLASAASLGLTSPYGAY